MGRFYGSGVRAYDLLSGSIPPVGSASKLYTVRNLWWDLSGQIYKFTLYNNITIVSCHLYFIVPFLFLSLYLSLSLFLSLSLCFYLSISLVFFVRVRISLSLFISFSCLSLSLSFSFLSLSLYVTGLLHGLYGLVSIIIYQYCLYLIVIIMYYIIIIL